MRYSVLDLSPIVSGSDASTALQHTIELAEFVESLDFHRFWLAEHHSMPGIASSAPAVMIGQVAARTTRMRVGSGGVMLPNHSPLVVAEQFGTLDALFPGRIDLGIGRAPGTDQVTAHALRRGNAEDFPQEFAQVQAYLANGFPANHPYAAITAIPGRGADLELWLLGSSTFSATMAGMLGLPFAFARHFSPAATIPAITAYRENFRPSDTLAEPNLMLTVAVMAAESDDAAQRLAGPQRLAMARLRTNMPGPLPTLAEAEAHPLTELQRSAIAGVTGAWIVGGPDSVRTQLEELIEMTQPQEIMISSSMPDFADRLASHEITARALCEISVRL